MMWLCRSGKQGEYLQKFIDTEKIYLSWDGYAIDFRTLKSNESIRERVSIEKNTNNRTSISNWAGQIKAFLEQIQIGDYVLIPSKRSWSFVLARVIGDYCFDCNDKDGLYHSRQIEIKCKDIPRNIFSQHTIYSLCAYRTIFKVHEEEEVLSVIQKWIATKK